MNKEINTETAAFYLQDYIESIIPDGAFEESRKYSAQQFIQYLINWHVEPAQSNLERNTANNGQK
tara:strand:- start:889 stop:1083 length:195 start_codon:yes stop_codon:yes gene_type:complete